MAVMFRRPKLVSIIVAVIVGVAGVFVWLRGHEASGDRTAAILESFDPERPVGRLNVLYPRDGVVFPQGIAPATFRWEDRSIEADAWIGSVRFGDGEQIVFQSRSPRWTPTEAQWQAIQNNGLSAPAVVTILGIRGESERVWSSAQLAISTSDDALAPIFYREVNLPFREAVLDPSRIRWRLGEATSREPPPVVLAGLPVCGNCHSFSADGRVLGMDVDYANDKASYALLDVTPRMVLEPDRIISWNNYRRDENEPSLGLLSQVSPDGRYVISTVKDGTVFEPKPDLAFSQLFFPIKGILAFHDRRTGQFRPLRGADDPTCVQSNASWSPDGKWIVFARGRRFVSSKPGLITAAERQEFLEGRREFRYDLYRVPFNQGNGGEAEPLAGASNNGKSNYFARYSPDGKWIVFCQARSFMLLQPDSELYIVPAEGGPSRRLGGNAGRMNSWHSWSPNSRWLVFASKALSPYTQLFLTHIDPQGNSSPPVVLEHFTEAERAANIPEFAALPAGAIQRIEQRFLDDHNFARQARVDVQFGDPARAESDCRRALALNSQNTDALCNLGILLAARGQMPEAIERHRAAIALRPDFFEARFALGAELLDSGSLAEAIEHLREAVRLKPDSPGAYYPLGVALQRTGDEKQALAQFERILEISPNMPPALAQAAFVRATSRNPAIRDVGKAVAMAEKANVLSGHQDPDFLATLVRAYVEAGRKEQAQETLRLALTAARKQGRTQLVATLEKEFAVLREGG